MTLAIEQDFSVQLDNNRTLWLTEISQKTFREQSLESLESDDGLFLVLEDITEGSFNILAKAASTQSGINLLEMMATQFGLRAV